MLKQLIAWLLIISVLTVNNSRLFVYVSFKLNQNYIAAKLCENRNRPWMHCDGKCYFMKKIKQTEDKQNNAERESQKNIVQVAYYETQMPLKFFTRIIQILIIPHNSGALMPGHNTIFRPPQLG